ncbi:MAG: toprim domain-containing protein [Candidatus Nitrosocaldaceae archaeon]
MHSIDNIELQAIYDFIESLNEEEAIVVVEGKRDKEALIRLGYKGNAIILNSFKGIYKLVEYLENASKVILLLDMDRKGIMLTNRILNMLSNVDLLYKKRLVEITKGRIRCIEELIIYSRYY